MNNEIKEILIQLEYFIEENYKYYNDFELNKNQIKQLLDYITNLQQENEKSNNENKQYKEYVKELKDSLRSYHIKNNKLINENERLKEANVYCNRTDCIGRIKDSRKYDSVYQEKEDYKSRCEKADNQLKIIMQIIKEQPNRSIKDDEWLENRLIGVEYILKNGGK